MTANLPFDHQSGLGLAGFSTESPLDGPKSPGERGDVGPDALLSASLPVEMLKESGWNQMNTATCATPVDGNGGTGQ